MIYRIIVSCSLIGGGALIGAVMTRWWYKRRLAPILELVGTTKELIEELRAMREDSAA